MINFPPNMSTSPVFLFGAAKDKELADLEDAVRDFGPRMARLRELGVPSSRLLLTYKAACKMCGQKTVFDAVTALPSQ